MTRDAAARPRGSHRDGMRPHAVRAVPFHDWVGEAKLQDNIAFGRRLEALAGLYGNRWLAVGMSIEPACGASTIDQVFIDAVDLNSVGISPRDSGFHDLIARGQPFRCVASNPDPTYRNQPAITMDMPVVGRGRLQSAARARSGAPTSVSTH
jgi:hypothetical protein